MMDPKIMQSIALTVLVKTMLASTDGRIRLTKDDFEAVDLLNDADKWTIEVDKNEDVLIGFLPISKLA